MKPFSTIIDIVFSIVLILFVAGKYLELHDLSWWWMACLILNPIKVFFDLGKKVKQFWFKRIQGRYG